MSKEWICKRCLHSTLTKSNLLSHLRNKTQCSIDVDNGGKNVPIPEYINELLTPKQPKNYSCPHCDSKFSYNQSMNKHIRGCQNNPSNKQDDKDKIIQELQDETQTIDELKELLVFYQRENELLKSSQLQVNFNITGMINEKQKYKKKNIPHTVKIKCWNTHVGELVPKVKCLCCHNIDITQHNFHCGHITAECNGGSLDIDNLLPICNVCNYSMGSTNMNEFKTTYGFKNS